MLNMREMQAQAKAVASVVQKHIGDALDQLRADFESCAEQVFKNLWDANTKNFIASDSRDELIKAAATEALKHIEPPKNGEDGKSVTVDELVPVLDELVTQKIAALPLPKDGKDADPETVKELVLAEIPVPQNGVDGKDGLDADPVQIKAMVDEAVAKIPQPKDGKDGENGRDGADGKSVSLDEIKSVVKALVEEAFAAIQVPKNGEPGRDGADIEILSAIDLEKSYPRGTYATHLGGLFRSYQATEKMHGWECIVDGIADCTFQKISDRKFNLQVVRSSGKVDEKNCYLPVMVYRGIYKFGTSYEPGDAVTWAGAVWHCDEPTPDKPGEAGSKGWTLCVKKGRDGKDGLNGKDLTKGVSIK